SSIDEDLFVELGSTTGVLDAETVTIKAGKYKPDTDPYFTTLSSQANLVEIVYSYPDVDRSEPVPIACQARALLAFATTTAPSEAPSDGVASAQIQVRLVRVEDGQTVGLEGENVRVYLTNSVPGAKIDPPELTFAKG